MAMYTPPPRLNTSMCVICGAPDRLSEKLIKAVSQPGWMWFLLPVAPVPALLLGARTEIQHQLFMPVCAGCDRRQILASIVGAAGLIASVVVALIAVTLGIANDSWLQAVAILSLAIAVGLAASAFRRRAFPRYSTLTREKVEVEIPGKGRVLIFPT
jgi:hypothetical protein